jgi:RNA polymerase primary sigma factor
MKQPRRTIATLDVSTPVQIDHAGLGTQSEWLHPIDDVEMRLARASQRSAFAQDSVSHVTSGKNDPGSSVAFTDSPVTDILASCRGYKVLTREDERALFQRLENGDEAALETLVASNVRLVAKQAFGRRVDGYPVEDIFQDGLIGLLTAIRKFEWRRGLKLSTYATWWIRQAIDRGIDDRSRMIRMPAHACVTVRAAQRATSALAADLGRRPTADELGELLDPTSRALVERDRTTRAPVSLEALHDQSHGPGREHHTTLPADDTVASVEESVLAAELIREVDRALSCLSPVERRVLTLHLGLAGELEYSYEAIALRLQCTRARVGQIATRALAKVTRHAQELGLAAFS